MNVGFPLPKTLRQHDMCDNKLEKDNNNFKEWDALRIKHLLIESRVGPATENCTPMKLSQTI